MSLFQNFPLTMGKQTSIINQVTIVHGNLENPVIKFSYILFLVHIQTKLKVMA